MGSIPPVDVTHHTIVALEAQFCPIPKFTLPAPFTYTLVEYPYTPIPEIPSRIKDATILLTTTIPLSTHVLSPSVSPNLRMIAVMASGTDTIDLEACKKRGIRVCNSSHANTAAVSEHALGLYFAARRKFVQMDAAVRANDWVRAGKSVTLMEDHTRKMPLTCAEEVMGLIGYGIIGKRIGQMARALGMKVLVAERRGAPNHRSDRTPFEEVLKQSTVLVLVLPRTPESLNLISTTEFKTMRQDVVLINISRGGILDEDALLEALREGRIAGAGIDVFAKEPAGIENNILCQEDTKGLNLSLTPHSAWLSNTTLENLERIVQENVEGWCAGRPVNIVV